MPSDASRAPRPPLRRRLVEAFHGRARPEGPRPLAWRLAVPAVLVLAGGLFVTSAVASGGTDLRAGRIADLSGLAASEAHDLEQLRARQSSLNAEVEGLTAALGSSPTGSVERRLKALRGPAGLEPVSGAGVTVTLDDAPASVQDTADARVSDLVVHQQDIQAVVNALWEGGATAMTIQGQRVISTTGIRCVGNSVVLHDVPYAPPYRISAVGPVGSMISSIDESTYIGFYLQAVAKWQLGWDVKVESNLDLPAYSGSTALGYARPAGGSSATDDGS